MTHDQELETLKYPIGQFEYTDTDSDNSIQTWIQEIEMLPNRLQHIVSDLSENQLDTPYRPEGWMVRQVVHHLSDSHMNGYIRFKWTLTENETTIKPYEQKSWSETAENIGFPISEELALLSLLHQKWVVLLKELTPDDFQRKFMHPESGWYELKKALALYAWHGNHHLAQIEALIQRKGW